MEISVVDGHGGSERVVTELSHVMELVRKLEGCLGGPQTHEECRRLASQISSLTERAIALITSYSVLDAGGRKRSAASPLSDASDAVFKTTKKRRTRDKVKNQVRVSAGGGGSDIAADDGHSWRKYGQKEILGAKYPRGYYRCTHRHSQGCAATKQVQRADEDPTLFDVVYLGDHTCVQNGGPAAVAGQAATATPAPEAEHNPNAHNLLQSLSSNLTVKTEGLAAAPPPQDWAAAAAAAPFCLPSTPASACLQAPAAELSPFSAPSTTSENWGVSPATSDSNQHAAAASFPPFEVVAAGDVQFGEVMSAFIDGSGEFHDDDFDISSFFA